MKHQRLVIACSAAVSAPLAWVAIFAGSATAQQAPSVPPALIEPADNTTTTNNVAGPQLPGVGENADSTSELPLGQVYESQSAGISFRPPADCKVIDTISSKYIAEWADAGHDWTLKLGKMVLDRPTPLISTKDNFGKPIEGILDKTVKNLKASLSGSQVLRQDVTNTRDSLHIDATKHPEMRDNVGLIAIRYAVEGQHKLSQQAIIQSNDGVFYLLTLTTPGSKAALDNPNPNAPPDANEVLAVNTFERMIDTVRMLDRAAILRDQEERLYHTRTAIVNWTPEKLHKIVMNEQWLRILKNGKDIGYSYITEDQAGGIPRPLKVEELRAAQKNHTNNAEEKLAPPGDGILIGVRAGTTTEGMRSNKTKGIIQTDSASWFFFSADKKHEDFSRVVVTDDHIAPKKGYVQEFGLSDKRVRRVVERPQEDPNPAPGAITPPTNNDDRATISYKEDWELNVTMASGSGNAEPLVRTLPPFYIPQALAHLLPRLLPLDHPQGYMFATYVSDAREVMMRYVDVLPEQNAVFNGQPIRAIPVRDRLGLQGSTTIHYMSIDGNYLGSENKDQKLVLLPTNDVTLRHIWAEANLTRPDSIDRNAPANATNISPHNVDR